MQMIQLTRWATHPALHDRPVFVRPEKINWLWAHEQTIARTPEERKLPVKDRPKEIVTWIDFGGDEDTGLQVQESPEEILQLIKGPSTSRAPTISFQYRNHRDELALRTLTAERLEYLPNPGYGYAPGWFITGRDNARDATRSFSLDRIAEGLANDPSLSLAFSLRTYS